MSSAKKVSKTVWFTSHSDGILEFYHGNVIVVPSRAVISVDDDLVHRRSSRRAQICVSRDYSPSDQCRLAVPEEQRSNVTFLKPFSVHPVFSFIYKASNYVSGKRVVLFFLARWMMNDVQRFLNQMNWLRLWMIFRNEWRLWTDLWSDKDVCFHDSYFPHETGRRE